MAEELKLQLGDRMPAVMQIAAKSMGMTTAEFLKAMEDGKVAAEDFLPAFSAAMRELAAPGLDKAFSTVAIAQKRMMAQWELFKKSLFDAGLDKLFKELFNMGEDLMVVLEPLLTFLMSTLTTILRGILWPIRLVIAVIADIIKIINHFMQKFLGFNLTDTFEVLGAILGTILTLGAGLLGKISQVVGLLKNTAVFRAIGWAFQKANGYLSSMSKYIDDIIAKLREMPVVGNLFKGGSKVDAAKITERQKMAANFLDKGAVVGSLMTGGQSAGVFEMMKNIGVEIFMNENAKDMVNIKVEEKTTDSMNSGTRG